MSGSDHLRTNLTLSPAQADALLAEWLGSGVHCQAITPLEGGMVNTVLRLDFDRANVTLSPFAPALEIFDRCLPEL
jgi:hypothetical protein